MSEEQIEKEIVQMNQPSYENAILGQLAGLLVQEKLIAPSEQLEFLQILKEEVQ